MQFDYMRTPHLQSVDKFLAANLALAHSVHALQDAIETSSVLVDRRTVHLNSTLLQQLPSLLPPHLTEFKVLGSSRHVRGAELEVLADDGVSQGGLELHLGVELLGELGVDGEQGAVGAAGGAHGF